MGRRKRDIFGPALLERQLRVVLANGKGGRRVIIRQRSLANAAYVDEKDPWDKGHHVISVNPMWAGWVPGVIHELMHLHLRSRLKSWGEFEEGFVNDVMERDVCRLIANDPRRSAWWEDAIRAKREDD